MKEKHLIIIFIFRENLVQLNVFFPENSVVKYLRDELYAPEDMIGEKKPCSNWLPTWIFELHIYKFNCFLWQLTLVVQWDFAWVSVWFQQWNLSISSRHVCYLMRRDKKYSSSKVTKFMPFLLDQLSKTSVFYAD